MVMRVCVVYRMLPRFGKVCGFGRETKCAGSNDDDDNDNDHSSKSALQPLRARVRGHWPIPSFANCSHHVKTKLSARFLRRLVPCGMKWVCYCWEMLTLISVTGAPLVDFNGLLLAVVLVIGRIRFRLFPEGNETAQM